MLSKRKEVDSSMSRVVLRSRKIGYITNTKGSVDVEIHI
jgi:hypothetical protein